MTSREKLTAALEHRETGSFPFELGATKATGVNASLLYRLRKLYGREEPVKIYDTYQMLGLVDARDYEAFGIDVAGVWSDVTCFGYRNTEWKPWTMPDGTPALVGKECAMTVDDAGNTFIYPQGDSSVKPSGRLPKNGHYFDQIVRQEPFEEDGLDVRRIYGEQFGLYDDQTLDFYGKQVDELYNNTSLGIVLNAECAGFGAATQVIGPMLKRTEGIRDLSEWMMAPYLYPEHVKEVYAFQAERAIANLKLLKEAVGDKPQVVFLSSTDFGTQRGLISSRDVFLEFYAPYYKQVDDWVHANTSWKTLFHSCGAVADIMGDFCDAGLDCLNPIQAEAQGMDPAGLKDKFGDRLVFWGGAVDSQSTISRGKPEDVERQFYERTGILGKGGGFVCAITHNLQDNTPVENAMSVFELVKSLK